LEKVLYLDAVEFEWNEKQQTHVGHDIGLIAQQVKEVAPEIVETRKDGYLAVKYEKIIPLLIGATREQDCQIQELEQQVQDLLDKSNC
jgi:predicted DNA-binding helix-hairpin-helix protein